MVVERDFFRGKFLVRSGLCVAMLFLTACATSPFEYPKSSSHVAPLDPQTEMGNFATKWLAEHGEEAGLVGLSSGVDALGARLRMLELAEKSVDAQYFIIKKDRAGQLFAGGMLAAADRGVKVRLLVDDIFSPGVDEAFTLLSSHPNIEIRIFNPLSRSARHLSYVTDFSRINRRMHNKSFTVDNSMSIVGGRNIGEEYFELKQDVKFDDYEVLVMGAVVQDISDGFDKFWNSDLSVPVEAFQTRVDKSLLDEWRVTINKTMEGQRGGLYATALESQLLEDLRTGKIEPAVAQTTLYTDLPEKISSEIGNSEHAILVAELGRRLREATEEVIIVTPYYVPQQKGVELMEQLLDNGVNVIVITNSLASTNHVPVHSGYSRHRKHLLRAGVEFYEIRADTVNEENDWGHNPETMTLHSKATMFDRKTIFIGSLNFDPRSVYINTEMGLFVDSEDLGEAFSSTLMSDLNRVTWKVDLDENDDLRWTYAYNGEREVVYKEPGTSWWRRFQAGFYRLLPIESQL